MSAVASPPLVSIGIPTFNRAALLERAIRSVLEQDHPAIEVVVSDNASTDDTAAVCQRLAAEHPQLRCIRQLRNLGPVANFNAVLAAARGDFFMWLSDDDWLDANYISACLRILIERPETAMVAGQCRLYDQASQFMRDDPPTQLEHGTAPQRVLSYYATVGYNSVFYGLMRAVHIRRMPMRAALGSDWDIVAFMAMQGRVVTIDSARVHRTLGGTSGSAKGLVRTTGLPAWQAVIPRLMVVANSAGFVRRAPWPAPARLKAALLTFIILFVRYSWFRRLFPRFIRTPFINLFV